MKINLSSYHNNMIISYVHGISTLKNNKKEPKKQEDKKKRKKKYTPKGYEFEQVLGSLFDEKI